MSSETPYLTPVVSFVGWAYLPSYATSILQSFWYKFTIRAGSPHPQPGTPKFARDHRRIRILVLSLYLLYTLLQALYDIKLAPDFYTILGVSPYSTTTNPEKDIRSKFRRLAAKYHPDKLDQNATSGPNDTHFMALKLAQDTLLNPNLRYAYTHFGPSIVSHLSSHPELAKSATISSLIYAGLRQKIPSYLISLGFLFILNQVFLPKRGQFWRYLIIVGGFVLELYLLTRELSSSTLLTFASSVPGPVQALVHRLVSATRLNEILPPHLLPFQILALSSKLSISLNIFISQVSSTFPPAAGGPGSAGAALKTPAQFAAYLASLHTHLANLNTLTARAEREASDILNLGLVPFKGDAQQVSELRRGMKEGMVLGVVRRDDGVKQAVRNAIERRRKEQAE